MEKTDFLKRCRECGQHDPAICLQCADETVSRKQKDEHFKELVAVLKECLLLIDDFMPNIAHCFLQNYKRLNEAPMNARTLIGKLEELKK